MKAFLLFMREFNKIPLKSSLGWAGHLICDAILSSERGECYIYMTYFYDSQAAVKNQVHSIKIAWRKFGLLTHGNSFRKHKTIKCRNALGERSNSWRPREDAESAFCIYLRFRTTHHQINKRLLIPLRFPLSKGSIRGNLRSF